MASTSAVPVIPPLPAPGSTNLAAADIHGIKDPVAIPTFWDWFWWGLAIAVAALIVWLAWKWLNKKINAPKPRVVVPPHRRAKDRLKGALDLISDPYQFCSLLSDVLREYLEARFNFHAEDRTTEEFLNELWVSDWLQLEQKTALEQFFIECDLVKFARHQPTETTLRQLLDIAERFVDETAQTSPVPPVPVASEGGAK